MLAQSVGQLLPIFDGKTVAGEKARFAFTSPMLRVQQIKHDLRFWHFGFFCEWQFHVFEI